MWFCFSPSDSFIICKIKFIGDFLERMDKGRASSVTKNYEVYEESSYYQRSTSLPRPMRGIEKHIEVSSNADLLRRRQEGLFYVMQMTY